MVMECSSSRHRWLLLVVALLGLTPSVAGSQLAGSIEQLEVALWPEYDRQAVLVMYTFRLKPDSLLPTKVALPIPASVGQPHAVAWKDESGGLMLAEFTRTVQDERAMILMNMQSLEGQLEYYADLTLEGPRRTFLFSWPGGVDLGAFSYKVQRPLGALGFEIIPPPDRRTVGQDGFTYEWVDHGPLEDKERPTIELGYEKDTAALSVQVARAESTTVSVEIRAPGVDQRRHTTTLASWHLRRSAYRSRGELVLVVFAQAARDVPERARSPSSEIRAARKARG